MAHSATFIAYVDESGDEGFRFDGGSSRWFVLSAAVFRSAQELNEVKLIDEVRARINQGRKPGQEIPAKRPLHFRDLRHEQRKFFAHRIVLGLTYGYHPHLQTRLGVPRELWHGLASLLLRRTPAGRATIVVLPR